MRISGWGRVPALLAAVLMLLALPACKDKVKLADGYEAKFDQLMANRAYPVAARFISQATQLDDNEPRRWLKLGYVSGILNRPQVAYNAYQRALDLAPDNLEALESLSILAVRSRNYLDAKRFVEPLLLLSPSSVAGQYAQGAILINARRYDEADAIAGRLIREAQRPEGYMLRSIVFRARGRLREAANVLDERLKLAPDDTDFLLQQLELYQALHDVAGIRRVSIALAPLLPKEPRYAMEAARAFYAQGDQEPARAEFDRLGRAYAGNADLIGAIGQFWREALPREAARDEIVRLAATKGPRVRARLGAILIDMGEVPAALELLAPGAAGPVAPDNIDAQTAYARALLVAGRTDEAVRKVAAITALDPTNSAALLLRARIRLERNKLPAALTDAQLAASGDQSSEEASLLVARIYAQMNSAALAAKSFGDARQRFPDSLAVVTAWADWLSGQDKRADATAIAADYARRHQGSDSAWTYYGRLCRASGGGSCADEVRRHARPA